MIFQGFAVMERLGTPQKQKSILEYCSPPPPPLSEGDVVKKRAAEAQKQQEARAAREKKEQERAAKFEELKSLKEKWGLRPMQVHDLLADMTDFLADKDEKLTPAQVSKMQKSLQQAHMLMKNIGVKNLGRKPASAGAQPKAEPKVETKPGEKRKRSKR